MGCSSHCVSGSSTDFSPRSGLLTTSVKLPSQLPPSRELLASLGLVPQMTEEDSGGLGERAFLGDRMGQRMRQRDDPGGGRVAGLRTVWTGNPRPLRCCQKGISEAPAGAAVAGSNDGVYEICWWCWEDVDPEPAANTRTSCLYSQYLQFLFKM